jgi:hypothetical protein
VKKITMLLASLMVFSLTPAFSQSLQDVCAKTPPERKLVFVPDKAVTSGDFARGCSITEYQNGNCTEETTIGSHLRPLDLNGDKYHDLATFLSPGPSLGYSLVDLFVNCGDDTFLRVSDDETSFELYDITVIQPVDKKNWVTLRGVCYYFRYDNDNDEVGEQYFILKFDSQSFKYKIIEKSEIQWEKNL